MNNCRICGAQALIKSDYPDAHFNSKVFAYLNCENCASYSVFPSPTDDDFDKMYGEEDHYYLKDITGTLTYKHNYPYANHHGYQIYYLEKIKDDLSGKTLLDYGCGSGFYMDYAQRLGAKVVGVEFDQKFVELLRKKTTFNLFTFPELKLQIPNKTFDYIHLGHVLEHLSEPKKMMEELMEFAHKDTIFLVDGPLERNSCLHRFYVDIGSKLKGKKYREAIPQHLTLTNKKSQLLFFKNLGLKKEEYAVVEQYFPLTRKIEPSIGKLISFFIASTSILISKLIPNSGNLFHYRGKIDKDHI
ncbi:MAG: hypothetical protein COB15_00360 [Flavobacteriales bacterium]|nr:MAG: hypothetical protein COB15_00360 [Flavobacteriales bacterium]